MGEGPEIQGHGDSRADKGGQDGGDAIGGSIKLVKSLFVQYDSLLSTYGQSGNETTVRRFKEEFMKIVPLVENPEEQKGLKPEDLIIPYNYSEPKSAWFGDVLLILNKKTGKILMVTKDGLPIHPADPDRIFVFRVGDKIHTVSYSPTTLKARFTTNGKQNDVGKTVVEKGNWLVESFDPEGKLLVFKYTFENNSLSLNGVTIPKEKIFRATEDSENRRTILEHGYGHF